LRIAFADTGGASWTGGLTYQRNLLEALRQYAPDVQVYLLTRGQREVPANNPQLRVIDYPPSNRPMASLVSRATCRLLGYDYLLRQTLRSIPGGGVDIVFPSRFAVGKRMALLAWIPDFQHVHLPEMYSAAEVKALDSKFEQWIRRATLVVLSSRDAQKDLCDFSPRYAGKARVMNFVARVPALLYETDPETVVPRYNLPRKFFYLPNQIWKHKNHEIVLQALKMLRDRDVRPFVVLTGNPVDTRNPLHFAELVQKISVWGLRDQIAFLGLVPHDDVYSLIRQSLCVLNPSLFEGWSTTVEEAKSVGKRVLVSDIAVHREQDAPSAMYFDPRNAQDLAGKLEELWLHAPPGPDLELERKAREAFPTRMKIFAETFFSIACEAVGIARGRSHE